MKDKTISLSESTLL